MQQCNTISLHWVTIKMVIEAQINSKYKKYSSQLHTTAITYYYYIKINSNTVE